jgi:GWxTD domain-containing protein
MRKKISSFLLLSFLCLLGLSCASYLLEKELDPASKKFLSEVRYLITSQERKIFLGLPPSQRKDFIEEFWNKRDSDPGTEENEFKDQYYQRIEEANRLFRQGTTKGWLQDRGRVYILLGPPERRDTFPNSSDYEFPTEIWYYGYFPIVFVDRSWSGDYRLEPLSVQNISMITRLQQEGKPLIDRQAVVFDFNFTIRKTKEGEAFFKVEIPYKNIWFVQKENQWQTTLDFSLEIQNLSGQKVWAQHSAFPVSFDEKNFADMVGKSYVIETHTKLEPGEYSLKVALINKTDNSQMIKKGKFTL